MTTAHLPECSYTPGQPGFGGLNSGVPSTQPYIPGSPCICPSLRACEQRSYTLGIEVGKHDGWVAGHAAGLAAAREAVVNAHADPAPPVWDAMTPDEEKGWLDGNRQAHADALAAIDELRNPPSLPPTTGRAHKY